MFSFSRVFLSLHSVHSNPLFETASYSNFFNHPEFYLGWMIIFFACPIENYREENQFDEEIDFFFSIGGILFPTHTSKCHVSRSLREILGAFVICMLCSTRVQRG